MHMGGHHLSPYELQEGKGPSLGPSGVMSQLKQKTQSLRHHQQVLCPLFDLGARNNSLGLYWHLSCYLLTQVTEPSSEAIKLVLRSPQPPRVHLDGQTASVTQSGSLVLIRASNNSDVTILWVSKPQSPLPDGELVSSGD